MTPAWSCVFDERQGRSWKMDMERGIAIPKKAAELRVENEMCARCHARRGLLTEDYLPGQLLAQTHHPALLEEGLYYADGQMEDEVYNWGSFLQSKMYAAGITCADCHDAHSAKVKISNDDVCSSCHQPERFATKEHHFHDPAREGGSCVACHMRTETYMVVDPRHDHSLRAPRPDLTLSLGSPNACNDCHRDKSARVVPASGGEVVPRGPVDEAALRRGAPAPGAPSRPGPRRRWPPSPPRPSCRPSLGPRR